MKLGGGALRHGLEEVGPHVLLVHRDALFPEDLLKAGVPEGRRYCPDER
jgi:hypothetical protein